MSTSVAAAPVLAQAPMMPAAPAMLFSGMSSHRCAECGGTFPDSDMIAFESAWVCAGCKPIFIQKLKEGIAPLGVLNYAGFWIRTGAYVIDWIILQIVNFFISMATISFIRGGGRVAGMVMLTQFLIGLTLQVTYNVLFVGRFGATPGKMALNLKIVRPNGEPIGYARALGRFFAGFLSGLLLFVGFMMAGWDEEKRALHDRICDTRVIRR